MDRRIIVMLAMLLLVGSRTEAQYMFLDSNGDGALTDADKPSGPGPTAVDIWLCTDSNRDGSRAVSAARDPTPLSIFSYEFILHASGGTVEWKSFTNHQDTMDFRFGERKSTTDYYTGFGGTTVLPPGKYRLGTIIVETKSGSPTLTFASEVPEWDEAHTSFGSMNPGKGGYHTLLYSNDRASAEDPSPAAQGDWSDADGLSMATISLAAKREPSARFGVSVAPNPLNAASSLTIFTTRDGFLRVRLFDVSGRLVRVLLDRDRVSSGRHEVRLFADRDGTSSGIYFYRVEASEKTIEGRIVVLK